MKYKLSVVLITFFALLICSLPITSSAAESKKLPEIEIKIAIPSGQNSDFAILGRLAKQYVEEVTEGRAKVKLFWSNSLVPLKDHYRALQSGILDFAFVNTGTVPGVFPLTELFQIPGIASKIAASNLAFLELFKKYPEFEKQFSPKVKYISTSQ